MIGDEMWAYPSLGHYVSSKDETPFPHSGRAFRSNPAAAGISSAIPYARSRSLTNHVKIQKKQQFSKEKNLTCLIFICAQPCQGSKP